MAPEVEQALLGGEHDAVLRLVVDLELRMVRAHVALAAGASAGGRARPTTCAGCGRRCRCRSVPSALGVPTLWHCSQPLVIADAPSSCASGMCAAACTSRAGTVSAKLTCSGVRPFSP